MNVHTIQDLKQMQALPLSIKIRMTEQRIRDWVNEFGKYGVYVSFSGGKDSTVLLDIVRNRLGYTEIPAVFVDTGLEYPEIREFVKTFENVVWLKPEMNFKQVIRKYGYPFFSKEIAQAAYECNTHIRKGKTPPAYRMDKFNGVHVDPKTGKKSPYNMSKFKFLVNGKFPVSHRCCIVMKKNPVHKYYKLTGRKVITAEMASESKLRTQWWIKYGCNGFETAVPKSMPMAFWTDQDVLKYIVTYNIPVCSVYGQIIPDSCDTSDRQISFSDLGVIPDTRKLKTTGCDRTGCMFCGFGCHLNNDLRFVNMKETHPKLYDYIMRPTEEGGLNYKEVIDWINENGNMHIKY